MLARTRGLAAIPMPGSIESFSALTGKGRSLAAVQMPTTPCKPHQVATAASDASNIFILEFTGRADPF